LTVFYSSGTFFRSLPNVYPGPIHYKRALKAQKAIKLDPNIKNIRNANRKFAAQSLDSMMKSLTVPITQLLNAYKTNIRKLHPYEVKYAILRLIKTIHDYYIFPLSVNNC